MKNLHIVGVLLYALTKLAINNWYSGEAWFTHCYFIGVSLAFSLLCASQYRRHFLMLVGAVMGLGDVYREITDWTGLDPYDLVGRKFLPYVTFCLGIILSTIVYGRPNSKSSI